MRLRTLVCLAGIAILALGASSVSAQEDVQALAEQWTAAYNKHDKDALGALYSENAALMMHGGPTITGRRDITNFWEGDFEIGSPLTVLQVTHSVAGVDMMLVHGNYQVISREDGVIMGAGRFAHIWMRGNDNEWRLDRDLWNEPFEPYD